MRRLLKGLLVASTLVPLAGRRAEATCYGCYLQIWPPYTECQGGQARGRLWCWGDPGTSCGLQGPDCEIITYVSPSGTGVWHVAAQRTDASAARPMQDHAMYQVARNCDEKIVLRRFSDTQLESARAIVGTIAL